MAARYIFNTSGSYVAFVEGKNLFDPASNWLGFIEDGDDVYSAQDGTYMGTLLGDDRLVVNSQHASSRRRRPMKPSRPLRPLRPLRRLRMSRLPPGLKDYFEVEVPKQAASKVLETLTNLIGSGHITTEKAAELLAKLNAQGFADTLTPDSILDSELRTASGTFLGKVNRNRFDTASLVNTFGPHGSRYSSTSIFNQYSAYGSPYGLESPYNKYSTSPPMFVKDGTSMGYLSVNTFLKPRLDPQQFIAWLENG